MMDDLGGPFCASLFKSCNYTSILVDIETLIINFSDFEYVFI
jgi:hypothetical protein